MEVNDNTASIVVTCSYQDATSVVTGFLTRNYHYKSVVAQVSHDAGQELFPHTRLNFSSCWELDLYYSSVVIKNKTNYIVFI